MSFDIAKELKRTFDLASLRREAQHHLSGDDWRDYQTIKKSFDDKRGHEKRGFERSYATHVETERRRLIDQAGAKAKHLKHRWFGDDGFDKAAIYARRIAMCGSASTGTWRRSMIKNIRRLRAYWSE